MERAMNTSFDEDMDSLAALMASAAKSAHKPSPLGRTRTPLADRNSTQSPSVTKKPAWAQKVFEIPAMPVEEQWQVDAGDGADEADELAVLVLANFQRAPPVDFGSAKVGEQRQVKIAVQNPGMLAAVVTIAKFPTDNTVSISWDERDNELDIGDEESTGGRAGSTFHVGGLSKVMITMTWKPKDAQKSYNIRELIELSTGAHRFQLKLVGSYDVPRNCSAYRARVVPKTNKPGYKPVFKVKKMRRLSASPLKKASGRLSLGGDSQAKPSFLVRKSKAVKLNLKSKLHKEATAAEVTASPSSVPNVQKKLFLRRGTGKNDCLGKVRAKKAETKKVAAAVQAPTRAEKYFDDSWIAKQERSFTAWINFVVAKDTARLSKRDMAKAHTVACSLIKSAEFAATIDKVDCEVDAGRLSIREDRNIREDVGLRQKITETLLSYSGSWLQLGLEVLFNEAPGTVGTTPAKLGKFVQGRLLFCPTIAAKFAHPTVPGMYRQGFEEELRQFSLKMYIRLIYFLDQAKACRALRSDPCLFGKDAPIKASHLLLGILAREALKGAGDIVKQLGHHGLAVTHVQTPLDEYEFGVTNLSKDLRNGVVLSKVLELLTSNNLAYQLQFPAVSGTRKIHNVGVALAALTDIGCNHKTSPKPITMGHREITLALLWQMIMHFEVDTLLNVEKMRAEIQTLKTQRGPNDAELRRKSCEQVYSNSERLSLLLEWSQQVGRIYGMDVRNFATSFADGRALLYMIHHYFPGVVKLSQIKQNTTLEVPFAKDSSMITSLENETGWQGTFSPGNNLVGGRSRQEQLANEKANFNLLNTKMKEIGGIPQLVQSTDMSDTTPDEKSVMTCVTYLCSRLLEMSQEERAARVIQSSWRWHLSIKAMLTAVAKIAGNARTERAAMTIQNAWRFYIDRKALMKAVAAITTEAKAVRARKALALQFRQIAATIRLQAAARGFLARLRLRKQYQAATCIQGWWSKLQMQRLDVKVQAVTVIQTSFRAFRARKIVSVLRLEQQQQVETSAAVCLQAFFRGCIVREQLRKEFDAAVVVQTQFRAYRQGITERERYQRKRAAAITIQSHYRGMRSAMNVRMQLAKKIEEQTEYVSHLSAITIQRAYRSFRAARLMQKRVATAITIQRYARGGLARRRLSNQRAAAVVIQRSFRTWLEQHAAKRRGRAALRIQSMYRGYLVRKAASKKMKAIRSRVIKINANLDERLTLANRTSSALDILLTHKQLSFVLKACENLNVATRLSTKCCEKMVQEKAVPVLFQLMRTCNRSKPHMAVLIHALKIISHLAKHRNTGDAVIKIPDSINMITELLQMYRDKMDIFSVAVSILALFVKVPENAQFIAKQDKAVKRIQGIYSIMSKKIKLATKLKNKPKMMVEQAKQGKALETVIKQLGV